MTETAAARVRRLANPDEAYHLIAQAHRGLDADRSAALNARLVLLLAHELGDRERLAQAVALALKAG